MASSAPAAVVFFLVVLSLLSAYASARPGLPFNTVFVSYTVTTTASSDDALPGLHRTSVFVSVYRIIAPVRTFHPDPHPARIARPALLPRREVVPAESAAPGFSSLHERAKDVLVVVIGLLSGVVCGAITAATMCLAWSLVTHRHEICGSDEYSEEEEGADESPKKAGYVKVPAADPVSVKEGACCNGILRKSQCRLIPVSFRLPEEEEQIPLRILPPPFWILLWWIADTLPIFQMYLPKEE